ncbi:MAG: M28 family peptidase [Crenarchaeota archaeon]|nr:M28 family peptidase [Thermoproteota archaeon]
MKILQEIDNPLLTYHIHPVPVLTFREKIARVEIDGEEVKGVALPYTSSSSTEGKLVKSIEELDTGNILITEFPEDVDDAKFILIDALRRGAEGVIFVDRLNTLRRIVVSSEEDYTYSSGKLVPIPVLAVPSEVGRRLLKNVGRIIKIDVDVDYRWSTGYNVEIIITEGEENLLITAHFDHWLTGLLDNALGIGVALSIIEDILTLSRTGVRIVLFTAEEFGIPNMASMYWTWGSKSFSEYLISNKLIDSIMFIINIDVVGRKPYMYTTEDIYTQFKILEMERSAPYFDTLNFETLGIPCITISSLKDSWDIYHTLLENYENINIEYLKETINALLKIFKTLNENKLRIDYEIYLSKVRRSLEKIGVNVRTGKEYEDYRSVRSVLSRNIVIWRRNNIEVAYSDNVIEDIRQLSMLEDLIKVTELGTGIRLISGSGVEEYSKFITYFRELIRYRIPR